jgi:hypothetical protein
VAREPCPTTWRGRLPSSAEEGLSKLSAKELEELSVRVLDAEQHRGPSEIRVHQARTRLSGLTAESLRPVLRRNEIPNNSENG